MFDLVQAESRRAKKKVNINFYYIFPRVLAVRAKMIPCELCEGDLIKSTIKINYCELCETGSTFERLKDRNAFQLHCSKHTRCSAIAAD